ncbi:MAG: aldo/keto reductase [Leptospirales bacterium]
MLGLGVYETPPGPETEAAVLWALDAGYRHIDTASVYGNEADVGGAIRKSGVPREEIFVTTKLWNADQGFREARAACAESLERLELEYVDLYLIHWPIRETRRESWRALESLYAEQRARAIGVSNFLIPHLEDLLGYAEIVPAVNQVELHPFGFDRDLRDFCRLQGIAIEAYAPLTRGTRLDHPVVLQIAEAQGKTAAQVLLRWSIQQGNIVLPKSVRRERIEANAEIFDFELNPDDLRRLDDLEEGLHTCWDPRNAD